jgi:hypothetical protein
MAEADQTGETAELEPKQPGLRFLEAAVYIMGGLLVLMLLGLLGGIAWKVTHRAPPESQVAPAVDVAVQEGANVAGMTLDGDRLAVHMVKGADHEIIVIDTRKGAVVGRIRLKPGAAPSDRLNFGGAPDIPDVLERTPPSSSGPGRGPLTAETGVRVP